MRNLILASLASIATLASSQAALAQPSDATPTQPAAAPVQLAAPPVSTTPPAATPAPNGGSPIELTSLKLMRDKGIISQAEYESAVKDVAESTGAARAKESNTLLMGKWATSFYGFVEADHIWDTTQGFGESAGNAQVPRAETYAGAHDRVTFTLRNSRIGFRMKPPEVGGVRTSAQMEMDFLGTQLPVAYGQPYGGSEAALFTNPTFRARHLNLKIETDVVDVIVGQYWQLFGWQSNYHPNTVEIQGVVGHLYGRTPQIRVSKALKTDAVNVEVAVAAMRPPQRNSATPEGQGGLRVAVNKWQGVHTGGSTSTGLQPLSVAVTGDLRSVTMPEFTASPVDRRNKTGAAVAIDAFVPVLPATEDKKGNSLSLNGEYVTGYGIGDMYTGMSTGIAFPSLPNPTNAVPAPSYAQDVDNNIAYYDAGGVLHLVQYTSYLVGLQYYLPGLDGKLWVSGNYSHLEVPNGTSFGTALAKVRSSVDWFDANVFCDVTSAVRLGLEYANTNDVYADGAHAINHRGQASAFFLF